MSSSSTHQKHFRIEHGVHRVQGSRDHQEDQYICLNPTDIEGCSLFGVFDGHGTVDFSAHASRHLPRLILESPHLKEGNVKNAFKAAFEEEDRLLYETLSGKKHGGSTATVALIFGGKLFVADVGDSRAVLAMREAPGEKLQAYRISHDHKPEDPLEAQRVLQNQGEIHRGRVYGPNHSLNMTRALGDHEYKAVPENLDRMQGDQVSWVPYVAPMLNISPQTTPFLIMASDGLWDCFEDSSAVKLVHSMIQDGLSCEEICKKVTEKCGQTKHSDNVTMILIRFASDDSSDLGSKQKQG